MLITTGSATRMGIVFACELIPVVILGIPSGIAVQRLGVRRTMLGCDGVRAPLIALFPILHITGVLNFGVLLALVVVVGAFNGPYISAQRLAIPAVVGEDEAAVVRGNGLLEGATRLANLLGPAVAGLLIAVLGSVNVLWADAGSYVASFALLTALPRESGAEAGTGGSGGGLLAGARAVLGDPVLRTVTLASLLFGALFPLLLASLPVMAVDRFDANPRVAGYLLASWGGGALLGALVIARLAQRVPPMRMGAGAAVLMCIPLWLLGIMLPAWGVGIVLGLSGIFTPLLNAPLITLLMLRTEHSARPMAITFLMTANLLAGPLGYFVAGPLLAHWGLRPVLLVVAAGLSVAALVLVGLATSEQATDTERQEAAVP